MTQKQKFSSLTVAKRIPLSRNLSFKQARNAVFVACVLGLIFSVFQIYSDLIHERTHTDNTFQRVLRAADNSAVQAAYGLDDILAQKVVDGLFEYRAVFDARIIDNHAEILARKQRPEKQGRLKFIAEILFGMSKIYSLPLQFSKTQTDVGTLLISVDTYVIADTFLERSGLILLSGVVRNLLLAAILGVLFHFMLTRPLKQVAEKIKADHSEVDIPKSHVGDELGELIKAYNDQFHLRTLTENELVRHRDHLQELVTERTRELSTAKLAAESANKAKSMLLSNVSHELRTPLNAIIGFSDLLNLPNNPLSEKQKEFVGHILDGSHQLLNLIDDILDLSDIESGATKSIF